MHYHFNAHELASVLAGLHLLADAPPQVQESTRSVDGNLTALDRNDIEALVQRLHHYNEPTHGRYPVCPHCGSTDIAGDGAVRWDPLAANYSVTAVTDDGFSCGDCERYDFTPRWVAPLNSPTMASPEFAQFESRQRPVCGYCHSSDIRADAYANWDDKSGDWSLDVTLDNGGVCKNCGEDDIRFVWIDAPPSTPRAQSHAPLTRRELAAVLTGLRLVQQMTDLGKLEDIITDGGQLERLPNDAIDELADRLNR